MNAQQALNLSTCKVKGQLLGAHDFEKMRTPLPSPVNYGCSLTFRNRGRGLLIPLVDSILYTERKTGVIWDSRGLSIFYREGGGSKVGVMYGSLYPLGHGRVFKYGKRKNCTAKSIRRNAENHKGFST